MLCDKICQLVSSSDACLVGYELTSLAVRVDIYWWYELTWVRVDICYVIRDVNSYHHLMPALLGMS